MNILIIPDSFKGSLTSHQVCLAIKEGIESTNDNCNIDYIPFSDGGEGFAKCFCHISGGEIINLKCHDIYGREIDGYFVGFGDTAVIESAVASGLQQRKNIMQASSYGTGELIKSAFDMGYKNIILGLGGSGCCDGAMGALSALGVTFYDEIFEPIFKPKAIDMNNVFGVSFKNAIKGINITFACDVENEYFGKNGAAYVFAPQKGARKTDVVELDEGLQRLNAFFNNDISTVKGGGAAGGICGGLFAVFGGEIKSGFDILCEYANLEEKIKNADLVITGEGKTDYQTLMGKLPYKICNIAKKHGKKTVVISGAIDGVTLGDKMISLVDENTDTQTAIENAKQILVEKSKSILQ